MSTNDFKRLDLLQVDSPDKHLFKPFAAFGFDMFSAGSSYSKFGVIVGIPANLLYEDESSVDKHAIKVRADLKLLQKSLVLSEKAQMYAMAREIKFRDTQANDRHNNCWHLLHGDSKPRIVRLILYCIVGAFSFGSYALCKDVTQVYFEGVLHQTPGNEYRFWGEKAKGRTVY
ncbi:hypothetical protein BDFB_014741 [Asbolus verrucosus]|uniref:Uncharacterized protein n=1 Tax=Asbolus verrucosus TaxID=1661398 RepID=A0A482VM39_ASBVE|nr:hypothetical protein BDFB_014741 [Asbolus verrucosus]